MKKFIILCLTSLLLFSPAAYSLDLQTAKNNGLVGETSSGYLGAVTSASAKTQALITEINAKRKLKYKEIAARNKTSLQTIEKLAGKKAMEKSKSGSYINSNGSWQKK